MRPIRDDFCAKWLSHALNAKQTIALAWISPADDGARMAPLLAESKGRRLNAAGGRDYLSAGYLDFV